MSNHHEKELKLNETLSFLLNSDDLNFSKQSKSNSSDNKNFTLNFDESEFIKKEADFMSTIIPYKP